MPTGDRPPVLEIIVLPLPLDPHPVLKQLVETGRSRGWICYEEVNTCLPDCYVDPDAIDAFMTVVRLEGIELIDELERRRRGIDKMPAELQTDLKFQRDSERKPTRTPKVQMLDEDGEVERNPFADGEDLGETTNVSEQHPQVVKKLLALAQDMRDDLGDFDQVGKNMRFFDVIGARPSQPPVPQVRDIQRPRKPKPGRKQ